MGKTLGTVRAFTMVAISCIASFMFAYDTGVIGGVLTLESFQNDFRYGAKEQADVSSNSTSLLQAGGKLFHPPRWRPSPARDPPRLLTPGPPPTQLSSRASSPGRSRPSTAAAGPS